MIDFTQAWNNLAPASGLMSWASPQWGWGTAGQTATTPIPQTGLAALQGRTAGEGTVAGYSTPGDPNSAATTSQATKDRVRDSIVGSLGKSAVTTGLGTLGNLAAGMPAGMIGQSIAGGLTSPGSLGGMIGGGINAALGTTPQGMMSKAIANIGIPGLGFAFGGPVGGLMGGMFGGVVADGLADALDSRKNEDLKDSVEDNRGYFGGRAAIADMQSAMDKVNAMQASITENLDNINTVRGFTGAAPTNYGRPSMSLDTIAPGGYGLGGTGSSNTSRGWGGYDPGHASTGFGLSNRAAEIARGALDGVDFGGFSVGGGSGGGRDSGGFGSNDGNSDTAGNGGYGR